MTWGRAIVVLALTAVGSAALVGLISRTPSSTRADTAPPEAREASHGASFSESDVARHGAYRRASYAALAASIVVEVVALVVLARGPFRRVVDALVERGGGWFLQAALGAVFVVVVLRLVSLPVSYVRGFVIEKAWGLSTQSFAGWLADVGRSLGVGLVVAVVTAVAFIGIVRWQPRLWWIWGWAAFSLLTVLFVFLWPVAIAPLFNKFSPLEDASLEARARDLAARAGIEVDEVLVADASRRTTAENAYVAGLGRTKQLVLFDTLLRGGDEDQAAFVIAHELGHQVEDHVVKNVALASATTLAAFLALAALAGRDGVWAWTGASGVGDVRALPLLMLFVTVGTLVAMPLHSYVSRTFETRADEIALELTEDPDAAIEAFRRLAFANLADLRPPRVAVWLLYTHPPITDRIRAAMAVGASAP